MCGLYGIFGPGVVHQDLKAFQYLAFLNQLRGMHSTGVARVWKEGFGQNIKYRTEIRKDTVCAQEFFTKGDNDKILNECMPVAIMGHNRYATVGDKTDINGAHPFENNRFIGFHNGTLKDKQFTTDRKFLTDSESLYDALANSENPQNLLETLDEDSAFALAYWDKHTCQIGFIRNKHRTLYFATNQKRNVVYYSSELEMLEFALDRAGVEYETYNTTAWSLLNSQVNDLSYVDKGEGKNKYRVNTWWITKFEPKPPVKPKFTERVVHYYRGGRPHSTALDPLRCKTCSDEVEYANGANNLDRKNNPEYVVGVGLICRECYDTYYNLNENTEPVKDTSTALVVVN